MGEAKAEGKNEDSRKNSEDDSRGNSDESLEERVEAEPVSSRKTGSEGSSERKVIYGKFNSKYSNSKKSDSKGSGQKGEVAYGKFEERGISNVAHSGALRQPKGKKVQKYAVAIIYHRDEYTGKRMFVLEENPPDYGRDIEMLKEERGKLRPPGGKGEAYDKSTRHTAVREFQEEIEKPGSEVLTSNFEDHGKYITTIRTRHPNEISETDVFLLEIPEREQWKAFVSSRWKHDAGYQRIYTDTELMTMPNDSFAYVYGPLIKSIVGHSGGSGAGHSIRNNQLQAAQKPNALLNLESTVKSSAYKAPETIFYKNAA